MAQKITVTLEDDLDGGPADETVRFGIDSADYEIDLSKKHADEFAAAIGPFIEAARKVTSARRAARGSRSPRHDQSDVRAWARDQGIKVSNRGRIPADVLARYQAAH